MKKEMVYASVDEFVKTNLNSNIASARKNSEYDFNFLRWKTVVFSSQKIKFVLKYIQAVLQWLNKTIDTKKFNVSIDVITVDRFNFSIYTDDVHIFNCSLITNFYLVSENDWIKRISEVHSSKFDLINDKIVKTDLSIFWKDETGFKKFANVLYATMKYWPTAERNAPIQWTIDFKDKKTSSKIREQLALFGKTGVRPEDPFLTMEQAEAIENGVNPDKISEFLKEENGNKQVINPIWDEAIQEEEKFKDINFAIKNNYKKS